MTLLNRLALVTLGLAFPAFSALAADVVEIAEPPVFRVGEEHVIHPPIGGSIPESHLNRGTINGYSYGYDPTDPAGSFSGFVNPVPYQETPPFWSVRCETDSITDDRTCFVIEQWQRIIAIVFDTPEVASFVCVPDHDFPGRTAFIRIDSAPAIETDTNGCVEGSLLDDLLRSSSILTRHVEWPYSTNVDERTSSVGLAEAIELMRFLIDRQDGG